MDKIFKNQKLNLLVIKKGLSSFKEKDNSADEFDQNAVSLPNKFNPLEENNENYNIFKYARNINQYCKFMFIEGTGGTFPVIDFNKRNSYLQSVTLTFLNIYQRINDEWS